MNLADKIKEKEQEQKYDVIFWKPNVGEEVEEVIIELGVTSTEYGAVQHADIITNEKNKSRIFINTILEEQFEKENIEKGDTIRVKFLGLKPSKKNPKKTYKDYVLAAAKAEEKGDENNEKSN